MCLSFILFAIQPWVGFSHSIAVHALAISGIGMMTISMMSRVSLGHTGRNIHAPPKALTAIFLLMGVAFVCRVILPILFSDGYMTCLMVA